MTCKNLSSACGSLRPGKNKLEYSSGRDMREEGVSKCRVVLLISKWLLSGVHSDAHEKHISGFDNVSLWTGVGT